MRLLLGCLFALAVAAVVGLGTTWLTLSHGTAFGAVDDRRLDRLAEDRHARHRPLCAAPPSRAAASLPIGSGDGVAFVARADDNGRPFDGRCDVVVERSHARRRGSGPSRSTTRTASSSPTRSTRHGFTSQEIVRRSDGSFEIVVAPRARAGNWLPTGGVDSYELVLRLYDSPGRRCDTSGTRGADACGQREVVPMIRWLLWLLAGALLGGIVHLMTVLMLPRPATQDAYARLSDWRPVNTFAPLPAPTAQSAVMPFMDPAFAAAVCRYDLSNGPLKLTAPVSAAYTSVSFYTRRGVAYYAINDRAAGRRVDRTRTDDDRTTGRVAGGRRGHRRRPADRRVAVRPPD